MTAQPHVDWPFLEPRHKTLASGSGPWAGAELGAAHGRTSTECRGLVRTRTKAGWLKYAVGGTNMGRALTDRYTIHLSDP